MLTALLGTLIDSIVKGLFGYLSGVMEKRGLIQQGISQQHTIDLEATVKEATDAATIKDQVQAEPDSAVADDLQRLRDPASSSRP